ncbi:MAG: EF-hand domain-containing protein [Pirellulaceae bacterium]
MQIKFVATAFALTLALTGVARADEAADKGGDLRAQLMKRFDKNGDGQLDESERAAAREAYLKQRGQGDAAGRPAGMPNREELLKRFDTDGDGRLSDDERTEAMQAMRRFRGPAGNPAGGAPAGMPSREEITKRFDKNGDGQLDEAERTEMRQAMQARFRNGAGQGNGFGIAANQPPRNRLDRQQLVERYDTNGNGRLDADEREKAIAEMRAQREKSRPDADKPKSSKPESDASATDKPDET